MFGAEKEDIVSAWSVQSHIEESQSSNVTWYLTVRDFFLS